MVTISFLVIIGVLAYVLRRLYKEFALETYRNTLFAIRGNVFDMVLSSETLSFDTPLYKVFEKVLNNNIRFAHNIDFLHILLLMLVERIRRQHRQPNNTLLSQLNKKIASWEHAKEKESLKKLQQKAEGALILYLKKTSMLFFVFYTVLWFCIVIVNMLSNIRPMSRLREQLMPVISNVEYQAEMQLLHIS